MIELFGKIEVGYLAIKSFTVLPHYPRKIKYLQNILKRTSFFRDRMKFFLGQLHKNWSRTEITRTFILLKI